MLDHNRNTIRVRHQHVIALHIGIEAADEPGRDGADHASVLDFFGKQVARKLLGIIAAQLGEAGVAVLRDALADSDY